jgi:hypothetical protein
VIRPIDTSLLDAVTKPAPSAPAQANAAEATGKNAFASQLKRAAKQNADTTASSDAASPSTTPAKPESAAASVLNRGTPAEGEKWRPVKGHDDYAQIIDGDRKGQYVNLNRGARRGEAFTIEQRDGKSVHVYKKDDGSELVIPIEDDKNARAAGTPSSDHEPPKGETWGPVDGHASYADILSGPRNGYYVNIQQGSNREGDVFHIVKKSGREYHVYGAGKDRTWVEVGPNKKGGRANASNGNAASGTSTQPASGAADTRDAGQTPATGSSTGTGATSTGGAAAASSGSAS